MEPQGSSSSTFKFRVYVPKQVTIKGKALERDEFFAWLWAQLSATGLMGIHEGTVLSEKAAESGLTTESWTLDSGEAPRERDWISSQSLEVAELYFPSHAQAVEASRKVAKLTALGVSPIEEQKAEDWDAKWKASFTGAKVPPNWHVLPPHARQDIAPGEIALLLNPGAGFGTGTHETTQLCLRAIAEAAARQPGATLEGVPVLDFGSGSGILSIGAALLGAHVDGVEIDPLAIENALENARLNGVEEKIRYQKELGGLAGPYPLLIANILKPVLLEFADQLVSRLDPSGATVVLSGLIEADVEPVSRRYGELLRVRYPGAPVTHEVRALNEWRSIVWVVSPGSRSS